MLELSSHIKWNVLLLKHKYFLKLSLQIFLEFLELKQYTIRLKFWKTVFLTLLVPTDSLFGSCKVQCWFFIIPCHMVIICSLKIQFKLNIKDNLMNFLTYLKHKCTIHKIKLFLHLSYINFTSTNYKFVIFTKSVKWI